MPVRFARMLAVRLRALYLNQTIHAPQRARAKSGGADRVTRSVSSEEKLCLPSPPIFAPGGSQGALDKPSILPDTGPMIRFAAAQHFWFFGYPTMLAAEGTRVI